ncbi:hypothetical protein PAPYR_4647 [Paratrimastix pyriformis]|uniref:Calcineurin-like phosphoesterase domain-containing protein n=1 Tax=Paratrimastix pyriformis TaxID=342808 RepID=A0ABQ8UPU3_9EUKA|nr:hypothetical protein PAPYR_4647 [Paratrimastix pyriformis]
MMRDDLHAETDLETQPQRRRMMCGVVCADSLQCHRFFCHVPAKSKFWGTMMQDIQDYHPLISSAAQSPDNQGWDASIRPTASMLELPHPVGRPWNLVLISDMHFSTPERGSHFDLQDQDSIFEVMTQIVRDEKADGVIVQGDLFHHSLSDNPPLMPVFERVLTAFAVCGIPMIIMGGNHDSRVIRHYHHPLAAIAPHVQLVGHDALLLKTSKGKQTVLMHDGGNNWRMSYEQVPYFIRAIRKKNRYPPDTILLTAHTHNPCWLASELTGCLGCFHPTTLFKYGLLRETPTGDWSFQQCWRPRPSPDPARLAYFHGVMARDHPFDFLRAAMAALPPVAPLARFEATPTGSRDPSPAAGGAVAQATPSPTPPPEVARR